MRIFPMQYALFAGAEGGNEVGYQKVVFAAVLLCCFAILVFEITKRM